MKEKYENTLEYNTKVAQRMIPILLQLDLFIECFEIKDLEKILEKMQSATSTMQAWPFPEAQNKAELTDVKNTVFECLIELAEARKNQRLTEQKMESNENQRQEMLASILGEA